MARYGRKFGLAFGVPIVVLLVVSPAVAKAEPAAPDLSGYQQTPVEAFLDPATNGGEVYFKTPDGLLCAIKPSQGRAGCDGPLSGAPAGANEIVLAPDQPSRGMRVSATPQFVRASGAALMLPTGHKIAFADYECAVGEGPITMCTKGTPPEQWMVVGGPATGIGPRTAGLPADYPDPNDFVASDESYVVGAGPKNLFPVFTVSGGLSCKMAMYSGGEVGCDGKLPGITNGDNEVYAQLPGPVGTRKAGDPPFSSPPYPGTVRQLPAGGRIDSYGATCMATLDGGVACYGAVGGPPQGFLVSSATTTTFHGS